MVANNNHQPALSQKVEQIFRLQRSTFTKPSKQSVKSPVLYAGNVEYDIECFPDGKDEKHNGHIAIVLRVLSPLPIKAHIKLTMICGHPDFWPMHVEYGSYTFDHTFTDEANKVESNMFCLKEDFLNKKDEWYDANIAFKITGSFQNPQYFDSNFDELEDSPSELWLDTGFIDESPDTEMLNDSSSSGFDESMTSSIITEPSGETIKKKFSEDVIQRVSESIYDLTATIRSIKSLEEAQEMLDCAICWGFDFLKPDLERWIADKRAQRVTI